MSFYECCSQYQDVSFKKFWAGVSARDIFNIIRQNKVNEYDFLALLSPAAEELLEAMAQRARQLSLQHFGKTIQLFTPMYISNHCVNRCAYCGFNMSNELHRRKLTPGEIEGQAKEIVKTGLKHILILTGESKKETPLAYIVEAVHILKKYFHSISIEIYPLAEEEYKEVIDAGVDGLTIYQEAYDLKIYDKVHLAGPKKNYRFRLDAPERACKAKMRSVNIGALLGLSHWRKEAFLTGLHAAYLQNNYPDVEVSVSLPRLRPSPGVFEDVNFVLDKNFVQIMLATRIFLPYVGMTISTRENRRFRDNLIPLGVTKMSAGVSTAVGGHTSGLKEDSQFEVADQRSVVEMKEAILARGYQPVFKNWMQF